MSHPTDNYREERVLREYHRRLEAFRREVEAQLYDRGYDWPHARFLTDKRQGDVERIFCSTGDPHEAAREVSECAI
jgi:hypothetical protein